MSETVFFQKPIPSLSTLAPDVIKQLKSRAEIFSKKKSDKYNPDFIQQYLNGNSSWVRVVSGVNLEKIDNAYKKYVLHGGVLNTESKKRQGFDYEKSFKDGDNSSAYTFEDTSGIVPMPGITSFNVANRGNSGFSREANFTIRCFSIEQLAIMEQLYMRPGYYLLVEWGHGVYVDNQESPQYQPIHKIQNSTVLDSKNVDPATIEKEGGAAIANSGHNYDYLLGFVKNYSWSYEQGYYELQVEVLGKGAASEYTKNMYGVDGQVPGKRQSDNKIEFDPSRDNYSQFSTIFKNIGRTTVKNSEGEDGKLPEILPVDSGELDKAIKSYADSVQGIEEEIGDGFSLADSTFYLPIKSKMEETEFVYVPLRFVLGAINYFYMPKVAGEKKPKGSFSTEKDISYYLTYEDHFSADITTCLLPGQTGVLGLDTSALPGKREGNDFKGDIMDIYVNAYKIHQLYEKIKKEATKDQEFTIQYFLKSLIDAIQISTGNINEFELYNDYYLDAELGPSQVVDRNVLPNPSLSDSESFELPVTGKESYISDFSINSALSTSMLNYITSQAILTGQNAGKAVNDGMSRFNNGIESRFIVSDTATTVSGNDPEEAYKKSKTEFQTIFETIYKKKAAQENTVEGLVQKAGSIIPFELQAAITGKDASKEGPARGHIGATISLEMFGIGGLKILEFFKLPYSLLPSSYEEAGVAFQINNISHDITNGLWKTRVEARAVIIGK
jgi:hypothetical protein